MPFNKRWTHSQRISPVRLGDLAHEFGPGHIHCLIDRAGFRSRIVLEDFHHQSSIVRKNYTCLQHAKDPGLTFRLTERSRSIDRYVSVQSFPDGCDSRKSRADFERATATDQLLATSSLDRADYARVVEGVDRRTVNDLDGRQRFDEFGERRTPHAVARRRVDDDRQL